MIGSSVPLVIALFAIPILIKNLGTDRFGLLAIIWAAIGYFSLFDLGLGRALTQLIANRIGRSETHDLPGVVWTALALMTGLGVVAAVLVGSFAPWVINHVLNVPVALRHEALIAMEILAPTLPVVILTAALIGVLEAHQRFLLINAVRIPLGTLTMLGPMIASQYTPSLIAATATLAAARLAACLGYLAQCLRVMPALRSNVIFDRTLVVPLASFGGWLTVSNVVTPVMMYFDRFLIGALLTLSAVAFYATPYEMVTRLLVIPGAVAAVLYPALAMAFAADSSRLTRLFARANDMLLIVMLLPLALAVLFAPEGLTLWLGHDFALRSTTVLRWLALGVLLNSMARLPYALIQGVGRPDITGKLHLLQLPPYAVLLWWLVRHVGVAGAAAAWTARCALDTAFLLLLAGHVVPVVQPHARRALLLTAGGTVFLASLVLVPSLGLKCATAFLMVVVAGWATFAQARATRWMATPTGWKTHEDPVV